jgi:hypothetical protein
MLFRAAVLLLGLSHEAIKKVFIRSKGFHRFAMETTCTKIILGS